MNFEFDDIDIDVPMGEFLVEASKDTPRWRVMLTLLPRAAGEPDSKSTTRWVNRAIYFTCAQLQLWGNSGAFRRSSRDGQFLCPTAGAMLMLIRPMIAAPHGSHILLMLSARVWDVSATAIVCEPDRSGMVVVG